MRTHTAGWRGKPYADVFEMYLYLRCLNYVFELYSRWLSADRVSIFCFSSLQEILKVQQTVRHHLKAIVEDNHIHLLTRDQRSEKSFMDQERSQRHFGLQVEEAEEVETSVISEGYVRDNPVSKDVYRKKKPANQVGDNTDKEFSAAAVADTSRNTCSSIMDESLTFSELSSGLQLKINQLLGESC